MAKISIHNDIQGLYRTLNKLPKEVSEKMRVASGKIAKAVADDAAAGARQVGGVAKYVAPTIKSSRDRVPVVKMGSAAILPLSGTGWGRKSRKGPNQTVGNVIWGAEYGGGARSTTQQFMPWRGNSSGAGYFLWPAVRNRRTWIHEAYSEALLEALEAI